MQANTNISNEELKELLEQNIYIIKQHIGLLNESEKAFPLKVYQKNLIALNEFKTPSEQVNNLKILSEVAEPKIIEKEPMVLNNAIELLIGSGLLVENQARHYKNYGFIAKCNEFINTYGQERFKNVLARVKQYKANGVKINNIYGYISVALDTEAKTKSEVH